MRKCKSYGIAEGWIEERSCGRWWAKTIQSSACTTECLSFTVVKYRSWKWMFSDHGNRVWAQKNRVILTLVSITQGMEIVSKVVVVRYCVCVFVNSLVLPFPPFWNVLLAFLTMEDVGSTKFHKLFCSFFAGRRSCVGAGHAVVSRVFLYLIWLLICSNRAFLVEPIQAWTPPQSNLRVSWKVLVRE